MTDSRRVDSEPAFILHARPYKETSQLLEVFTQGHGRVGLVARGVRRPKSQYRGVLQLFQPLSMSWSGRSDLATLRSAEPTALTQDLVSTSLMAGFYINELVMVLLHRSDPHRELFAHYTDTLAALVDRTKAVEVVLRQFELILLEEVGYGLSLGVDSLNGQHLDPEQRYEYRVEAGVVTAGPNEQGEMIFAGSELLAIGRRDFSAPGTLKSAKRLLRNVLEHHLGSRALKTRAVFAAMTR